MPQNRVSRPGILGIVGDSATGKTTLSAGIAEILGRGRVTVFLTDDYHKYLREERAKNARKTGSPPFDKLRVRPVVHAFPTPSC
jgi:phosphoribulokinase